MKLHLDKASFQLVDDISKKYSVRRDVLEKELLRYAFIERVVRKGASVVCLFQRRYGIV